MIDRELPTIARGGVPLEEVNPQPKVREAAEKNRGWDYSQEVAKLYRRADTVVDRLFPVIHTPGFQGKLPPPLIAIDNLRNKRTLAAYRLVPDGYGLNFKITFNEQHYADAAEGGRKTKVWKYGEWAQCETLVHEIGHHKQQLMGKDPFSPKSRVTHNKEFRQLMQELGIYSNDQGAHFKVADIISPFGLLMKEWGLLPPEDLAKAPPELDEDWFRWLIKFYGQERKGKSTLKKWCCPECGLKVRMGIAGDPMLRHHTCEESAGHPVFLIPGDVYVAKK